MASVAARIRVMFFLGLVTGSLLFSTVLFANGLQILSLLLWPFSRYAFRRTNRWIAHCWWGLCVLWAEHVHRIKPLMTGDDVPNAENVVLIANHQQMSDIVVLMTLAWRKKRLGDLKWLVKDEIKYVPGIGWGMLFFGLHIPQARVGPRR